MTELSSVPDDQLDFGDDDETISLVPKDNVPMMHGKKVKSKVCSMEKNGDLSDLDEGVQDDDGELRSGVASEANNSESSEEGEVLSEIEEMEVTAERSPSKVETPWERGVRLARERIEKGKVIKASEKDLAEKRMNLEVPAVTVEEECDLASKENILWPSYYQVAIIGRTELTGIRFLPEDLQPPIATELAEWRLGLSDTRRGRQRRQRDPLSSRSGSSSSEFSSRSSSSDSASAASSVASIAASWRATCAHALKEYLNSPIRNKDRRGGRGRGGRYSRSASSGSDSQSSRSRSESEEHVATRGYRPQVGGTGRSDIPGRESIRYWSDSKQARPSRSESEESSKSRSGSRSSANSRQQNTGEWGYDRQQREESGWKQSLDQAGSPSSPMRRRSDVPPLPHEKPIKRPWVAAPGMAAAMNTDQGGRAAQRPGEQSDPRSPNEDEDKQFITTWSRTPVEDNRVLQDAVHRDRLPDVVPGSHVGRPRHGASPIVNRTKTRSPFGMGNSAHQDRMNYDAMNAAYRAPPTQYGAPSPYAPPHEPGMQHSRQEEASSGITGANLQAPPVGELPSAATRPGVKITLAPRLKSSAVDISNLAGSGVRIPGRGNQPSPPRRLPRLPFPLPPSHRGGPLNTDLAETPGVLDPDEIRRHAEAAAKIVEAREKRRAAAEAARRRRNPKKKKDELSKIPIRGRPTYRRRSFTDSSLESGSSKSSRATSRSGSASKSRSGSTSPQSSPVLLTMLPQGKRHRRTHKRHQVEIPPGNFPYDQPDESVGRHRRQAPRVGPPNPDTSYGDFMERRQHQSRAKHAGMQRHFDQSMMMSDAPVKFNQSMHMKDAVPDFGYAGDQFIQHSGSRHREPKSDMMRHRNINEDFNLGYQEARRQGRGPVAPVLPSMERPPMRPRTPHAGGNVADYGPYGGQIPGMMKTSKHGRKRNMERDFDALPPTRKRAMIPEPVEQPSISDDLRQARGRHRSRAPGGPIDRSEPFESDDGSFAAEQRLRELRERLNFVDGAIAELRAGSSAGFSESRR